MSTERNGTPLSERSSGVRKSLEIIRIPMQLPFTKTVLLSGICHGRMLGVSRFFLRRGGTISCEITGRRKYSHDLPQGGLEVPCVLTFKGDACETV